MTSHKPLFPFFLFIFLLSACAGVPILSGADDDMDIPLGPQISTTEQQVIVFESILSKIEEEYIHYEAAQNALDPLREKYIAEINTGLTSAEFNRLMTQFENEFGADEVLYVSREERIDIETSLPTTQFVGIGAFVHYQAEPAPHIIILDVIPNSPAEKAGIRAHDSVYAVDGEPIRAEEGASVIQRIRGEAGVPVVLSVQSPGEEKREVEIIRAPVNGVGQLKINLLQNNQIGYILMPPSVPEDVMNKLVVALSEFEAQNIKGLILDLRIANGQNNWPLQDMMTIFLNGRLGDIYNRTESETINITGQDFFGSQTIPLALLVGEQTYGAAEIFAAFAQASGRGIVIGAKTSGNIEATLGYPLQNGGQIFIASTSIRTDEIENLGLSGFTPKIQVDATWDEIIAEQDPAIEQALAAFELEVQE